MSPNDTPAHVDGPPLEAPESLIWIGDIPSLGARQDPHRDAIIFADRGIHMSYAHLDALSNGFASMLQTRGFAIGDRIAYLGKNSDLFFVALFGAIRAGMVLVPINWRLAPPEIRFQLLDTNARLLIFDAEFLADIQAATRGLENPPALLPTEDPGGLRDSLRPLQVLAARADAAVILQLYTSGTTGTPKGVLISHRGLSLARHAELFSKDFSHITRGCVALSAMPNFHIGGMSWVMIGLVRVGTVVLTADPSVANLLSVIRRYDARHTWMVPTLIRAIVEALPSDRALEAPRFDGICYGAMPMDVSLLRQSMKIFGCAFLQFFGMTELSGPVTLLGPSDHDLARPELLRSVGKPYPGMSIEIRDSDGRVLNCGQHGEIWIKSPTLMEGYWNLADKTAETVVEGWYASGDGGFLDEEGYLYLTDRIKEMIVSGGENIYPVELEQVLRVHPAVLEAAVVGLPDSRWGERVIAVVERRHGTIATKEELLAFCRGKIADYKCPKDIEFTDTLPRTASGKVQRAAVRLRLLHR